jgi:hypothetical protein
MVEIVCIFLYVVTGAAAIVSLWHTLAMQSVEPGNKADIDDSTEESNVDSRVNDTAPEEDARPKEIGGRGGLDPTRYGDWEKAGRCIDF